MLDQLLPWRFEANYVVLAASTTLFACMSVWWLMKRRARTVASSR